MENRVIKVGGSQIVKTIEEGLAQILGTKEKSVIELDPGHYFISETIEITSEYPELEIRAKDGENVVLSGSLRLENLVWTATDYNSNIYVTKIEKNLNADCLFLNGEAKTIARFPNYDRAVVPFGGVTDEEVIRTRAVAWKNPETGYIRALHDRGWGSNNYIIEGRDETTNLGLKLRWVGDNNRGNKYMTSALVVENILEELDAPGEWFYQKDTGNLFYYPETPLQKEDVFELAVCEELFYLKGKSPEESIQNISFNGLNFEKTRRTLFSIDKENRQYIPLMRGDWAVVPCGVIRMEYAERIHILGCTFSDIGGNGIFMYGYQKNHVISDNVFSNIGSTAIQIIGKPTAVDDPSFWEHANYPDLQVHATKVKNPKQIGPVSEDYPRDIRISNNEISNIGIYEKQSSGVNLSIASRISILHNTIYTSARSNINVNDGSFGGHEIAYNDVFDSQRETLDHGPFNSWGRDRFWSVPRYNASGEDGDRIREYLGEDGKLYDITKLDAYQTTNIHDNRFHHQKGAPHSWGIDLDDGSSNYRIYNNLCLGIGIKLREGFDREVFNNIIVDGKLEIHVPYAKARDAIYSNVIVAKSPWGFAGIDKERLNAAEYNLHHNWYFNFDDTIVFPKEHALHEEKGSFDSSSIQGIDPCFQDPHKNDYTIRNEETREAMGFVNFPMNQFGRKTGKGVGKQAPYYGKLGADHLIEETESCLWLEANISNINDSIISSTASFGTKGVYLETVSNFSEAYEHGFRQRDIIKAVSGIEILEINHFMKIMEAKLYQLVKFTIHRENETVELETRITKL